MWKNQWMVTIPDLTIYWMVCSPSTPVSKAAVEVAGVVAGDVAEEGVGREIKWRKNVKMRNPPKMNPKRNMWRRRLGNQRRERTNPQRVRPPRGTQRKLDPNHAMMLKRALKQRKPGKLGTALLQQQGKMPLVAQRLSQQARLLPRNLRPRWLPIPRWKALSPARISRNQMNRHLVLRRFH